MCSKEKLVAMFLFSYIVLYSLPSVGSLAASTPDVTFMELRMSRQPFDSPLLGSTPISYLELGSCSVETDGARFRFNLTVGGVLPDPVELFEDDDGSGFLRYQWKIDAPPLQTHIEFFDLEHGDYRITVWCDAEDRNYLGYVDFVVDELNGVYEGRGWVEVTVLDRTISYVLDYDLLDDLSSFSFMVSSDTIQEGDYYMGEFSSSIMSVSLGDTVENYDESGEIFWRKLYIGIVLGIGILGLIGYFVSRSRARARERKVN